MEYFISFLLGLLQGITEFLPISSSGHLVFAEALLGFNPGQGITFIVVIHFGTLCSIFVYYREKLAKIIRSWGDFLKADSYSQQYQKDSNLKLTAYVLLSMIPAGIVGILFRHKIEELFMNPQVVSWTFLITGVILLLTYLRKVFPYGLNFKNTFLTGIAQAIAITPGISRSGSTISTELYLGVEREKAADFSFLMVIPVIAGAMILEFGKIISTGIPSTLLIHLIIGFVTSFVSGYFAIKYLIKVLKSKGIWPFGIYCLALGIFGLFYF